MRSAPVLGLLIKSLIVTVLAGSSRKFLLQETNVIIATSIVKYNKLFSFFNIFRN